MVRLTRTATTAVALTLALALPVAAASTASATQAQTPTASAAALQTASALSSPSSPAADTARSGRARLPLPTGPYGVGSSVLHLVDRSRTDPWVPSADARELMVTLHYPAAGHASGRPARYATTEEAKALVRAYDLEPAVQAEKLAAMRTHSRVDARPAKGKHPLVVLSPGFSVSRYTLTSLAEDLASRGYIVASVDHAYESNGISLPDGRLLTCVACTALGEGGVHPSVSTTTRAKDVSFVLDRLTGRHPAWRHAKSIDTKRVGMAGHSIGGASAATAMAGDPRVKAGVNMDGSFWEPLPADGLGGRPFMLLGTDDDTHRPGGEDKSWDQTWAGLGGWKRWLTVAGSEHFTFSDSPVITDNFGLPPQSPLPADRAVSITRAYVAAFFDEHLRGVAQPLLAGPSSANPEVKFHNP
ncbi:alpha/beta hydrolase [Streptomyces sp. NPDC051907]|uniref:alpha/beta hydrolase family protein n=1 Tax=Streptomyces sp. NPDC051907 TaxID=3155284 RepID=UPI0034378899